MQPTNSRRTFHKTFSSPLGVKKCGLYRVNDGRSTMMWMYATPPPPVHIVPRRHGAVPPCLRVDGIGARGGRTEKKSDSLRVGIPEAFLHHQSTSSGTISHPRSEKPLPSRGGWGTGGRHPGASKRSIRRRGLSQPSNPPFLFGNGSRAGGPLPSTRHLRVWSGGRLRRRGTPSRGRMGCG